MYFWTFNSSGGFFCLPGHHDSILVLLRHKIRKKSPVMADLQLDDKFYHYENIWEHPAPCISVVIHLAYFLQAQVLYFGFPSLRPFKPYSLFSSLLPLCCRPHDVSSTILIGRGSICLWSVAGWIPHSTTTIAHTFAIVHFVSVGKFRSVMPVAKILNMCRIPMNVLYKIHY